MLISEVQRGARGPALCLKEAVMTIEEINSVEAPSDLEYVAGVAVGIAVVLLFTS